MNKKYLVLPAGLVVGAAAIAAIQLWPSELERMREGNVCLGMLTEETSGLLQDGKGGYVVVDEDRSGSHADRSDPIFSTICFVNRENPGGDSARGQYTLDVRPVSEPDKPVKDATRIGGGLSGWVSPRQSEVLMPSGCAEAMNADAPEVKVTLKISPAVVVGRDWDNASLTKDSRTVILEAVDNLAKQYDCQA